ncbi:MAG: LytTR family DNA-binding domain-containing protein [Prolixibacteraceae bacterium]|jgi:two-component system LytT family response regulator|nr:LytTR family DNA-binding domain-containing protein [Prolixibacteraceae bacterium]
MISCLIIDDEENGRRNIEGLISENCRELQIVGQASGVNEAVSLINTHQPQLLFLDIEMTDGIGFDILEKFPKATFEVVFVTAYNQYGLNAIKFSAIDYLLKPIDTNQFLMAVQKAIKAIEMKAENIRLKNLLFNANQTNNKKRIALPFVDSIEFVEVGNIVRLEADGSYTRFYLSNNEELIVSGSLKDFVELLTPYGFIRTHQAHLVNPEYIKRMVKSDGGYLILHHGSNVPISRLRKNDVINRLRRL